MPGRVIATACCSGIGPGPGGGRAGAAAADSFWLIRLAGFRDDLAPSARFYDWDPRGSPSELRGSTIGLRSFSL